MTTGCRRFLERHLTVKTDVTETGQSILTRWTKVEEHLTVKTDVTETGQSILTRWTKVEESTCDVQIYFRTNHFEHIFLIHIS